MSKLSHKSLPVIAQHDDMDEFRNLALEGNGTVTRISYHPSQKFQPLLL